MSTTALVYRETLTLPSGEVAHVHARFGTVTVRVGDTSRSLTTDDDIDNFRAVGVLRRAIEHARDVMTEARRQYQHGRRRGPVSASDRGLLDRIHRGMVLTGFDRMKLRRLESLGLITIENSVPTLTLWGHQEIV